MTIVSASKRLESTLGATVLLGIDAPTEMAASMQEENLREWRALEAKVLQHLERHEARFALQLQQLDALCASVEAREAATIDTSSLRLQTFEEGAVQSTLCASDAATSEILTGLQTLEEGAVQRLHTLCTSMKARDAVTSDISIHLQTLVEGAVQRIDTLCTSMEARDAVTSNISTRLRILEEGAVSQQKKLQSDLDALKVQNIEDLLELRNDFNKKKEEELSEIRNERKKQDLQVESLVSIVTELEVLFLCTKQDLQHEPLDAACQNKVNELHLSANHQIQNLETQVADLRSSLDKCLPLGTLVQEMQCSMSEQKRCHDSLKEQVQNALERFGQEKGQSCQEIAPLKIDASGLHQRLESYMIEAEGCKKHQEKKLSQAESNASNFKHSFQAAPALYDKLLSFVPAPDPSRGSQIACLDANLGLLRSAFQEQSNVEMKAREVQAELLLTPQKTSREIQADQQLHMIALDAALMQVCGGHTYDSTLINDNQSAHGV